MLKTVYRSSCRDKHNCQRRDLNMGPLTPQSDALTTRLLRPACLLLLISRLQKSELMLNTFIYHICLTYNPHMFQNIMDLKFTINKKIIH